MRILHSLAMPVRVGGDGAMLRHGVPGITAYGFRKCQLDAAIARLGYRS